MRDQLLRHFPPRTHALTAVSDPDDLLGDEGILGDLADRGFAVIAEEDPVRLRVRVESVRPWAPGRAVVIITRDDLRTMPFDLWQQAHRVALSLHDFFPRLSYPIVRSLSSPQRLRLAEAPPPIARLGETASRDFVLRHAFDVDPEALREPAGLVAWLNRYHARREPLPDLLRDAFVARFRSEPALADINLAGLLDDFQMFARFVRDQWTGYVRRSTGQDIEERKVSYLLDFEQDTTLQDEVVGLVRTGILTPVEIAAPEVLPVWARPGVQAETDDSRDQRVGILLKALRERLGEETDAWRWDEWQDIAKRWAELAVLRFDASPVNMGEDQFTRVQEGMDRRFLAWLRRRYTALGGQKLPRPHHVHHVPYLLARERLNAPDRRVALVVIDGMSLVDWQVIAPEWHRKHPQWKLNDRLLLAQVPTITAVSRQALVSGRRPNQFAESITNNAREARLWTQFWTGEGLDTTAIGSGRVDLDSAEIALPDRRVRALYWVTSTVDEIIHGATLGTRDVLASLRLWLNQRSPVLEAGIQSLLDQGCTVVVASDHGHVEARGIGIPPSEGMAVETKGKRARTYRDRSFAERARDAAPGTVIWGDDGLLPEDLWALVPETRTAFASAGDTVVTHGGVTIDEVVVPLITITMETAS